MEDQGNEGLTGIRKERGGAPHDEMVVHLEEAFPAILDHGDRGHNALPMGHDLAPRGQIHQPQRPGHEKHHSNQAKGDQDRPAPGRTPGQGQQEIA
jgi:hypothetical protein